MTPVLCVGLAGQDFIFLVQNLPSKPEKYRSREMIAAGGGLAATAAVAAARLGGRVSLATRLGDDWIADHILQELASYGVDCTSCRRFAGLRSSVSAVLVTASGERLIVNHSDDRLPDDPSWLPPLPPGTRAVHGDMRWEAGSRRYLEDARRAGVPGILDVDRAPEDQSLIARATHAAFSTQAVTELLGPHDPGEAVARLARLHGNWVAVTDGGSGTWFGAAGKVHHQAAFPITPVDTLGAGDVFHGALTLALGEGQDEAKAVRFASAAAALKCQQFGGRLGAPTRAETEAFLPQAGAP
jgi:sulfofructose kinase